MSNLFGVLRQNAALIGVILLGVALSGQVRAQPSCPDSIVKLVVPFPPGGPVDTTARIIADPLKEVLGKNVIVENRSGASGSVATAYVAQQPGNGCTILLSYDTHGVNPALYTNLPFNTLTAFKAVTLIGTLPDVMAVHPSRPWKTLDDVMAAAKVEPDMPYTTGSTGTLAHLAMLRIEQIYGVKMRHVSYRGAAPALADTLGGHVPMMLGSMQAIGPSIRDGKLRAIIQTGQKRHPLLPDTPTISEIGHPGYEVVSWIGALLPASASDELVNNLNEQLKKIIENKSTRDRLATMGIQVVASSPADLQRFIENEIARWTEVVRKNNIKAD